MEDDMKNSVLTKSAKKEAIEQSLKKETARQSISVEIARLKGEHKGAVVRLRSIEGAIQRLEADLKKYE